MSEAIFLDTVGLLALWDQRDKWHSEVQTVYQRLKAARSDFFTTSYVLLECGNAAARQPYRSAASDLKEFMTSSGRLIHPTDQDWENAWNAYRRGEGGNAGIVDQVSIVVMRRLGLIRAFTNDRHFQAAGFEVLF
jgi:uncharacterized protein